MPGFTYDPKKSFRAWLRTLFLNKWRDLRRRQGAGPAVRLGHVPDQPGPDPAELFAEDEYRHYLVRCALEVMRAEFAPTTWKACWEHLVVGRPAQEVAAELGVTASAVYVAKFRVLKRLRRELGGLLD